MNFKIWLETDMQQEKLSLIRSDIIRILAGVGTSEGDALKTNLSKKVKGKDGIKTGPKAVEAILNDNRIFERLREINPSFESNLRQSIHRAKSDYYDLGTLLKDTFGDKHFSLEQDRQLPKLPPISPKNNQDLQSQKMMASQPTTNQSSPSLASIPQNLV